MGTRRVRRRGRVDAQDWSVLGDEGEDLLVSHDDLFELSDGRDWTTIAGG